MTGILAIAALVVSALLLATMILALVLLRKGEGPVYGSSQAYEANRRAAVRALTGEAVEALPGGQWYDPAFDDPGAGESVADRHRVAVREAIRAVAPAEAGVELDREGRASWTDEAGSWRAIPAVSTAAYREALGKVDDAESRVVGLVLFNPEPPGGSAARVTLPVQALFPALERGGRSDLVRTFRGLREEALPRTATLPGGEA